MAPQDPELESDVIELDVIELDAIELKAPQDDPQLELDSKLAAAEPLPNCLSGPAVRVDDDEIDVTIDIDPRRSRRTPSHRSGLARTMPRWMMPRAQR
jgi:hypothetical protein